MKNPQTHEERLAMDIERVRLQAVELGMMDTALRLEAAGNELTHERRLKQMAASRVFR
jgi:hypothetical protein